jgi:hypothetical protein
MEGSRMSDRFCKDCRWIAWHGAPLRETSHAEFRHSSSKVADKTDLVTGEIIPGGWISCRMTRSLLHGLGGKDLFGPEGKFWEPAGFV